MRGADSTPLPHESSVPTDWNIMLSHIILEKDISGIEFQRNETTGY